MSPDYGELLFAVDNDPPKGFTNTDANRDQVKDDSVIRELLQNALDSGTADRRSVGFTLADVDAADIHGLDAYRQAFKQARSYLEGDEPPTGQQMITRIGKALAKQTLRCLICSDDGRGLAEKELRALYGSGRSTKVAAGRGSVGHGHLTAFVPSDLRYVLYAGRRKHPGSPPTETFGGHAILASHLTNTDTVFEQRSADGFIRGPTSNGQPTLFDYERGGTHIPPTVAKYLPPESGSVVMIAAYTPVSTASHPERLILAAAARHFLVAVQEDALHVTYTDPSAGQRHLDQQTLPAHIKEITPDRDRTAAQRTLRTLRTPRSLIDASETVAALGAGVRVWLRQKLDDDEPAKHRVSVFRDGMWIQDNTANYLQPRNFAAVEPFDAVVDLDSSQPGSMGDLVRNAEGASHRQITPSELDNPSALIDRIKALQQLLIDNSRPLSAAEPYAPPQLRLTGTTLSNSAIPKRRPPRPDHNRESKESQERETTVNGEPGPGQSDSPAAAPQPAPDIPEDKEKDAQSVKAGTSDGLSTSCRPDPAADRVYHVAWHAAGRGFRSGAADLCMALPSGTDQTSRHRIAPEYLTIAAVRHPLRRLEVPGGAAKQVRITHPTADGSVEVQLTAAAADKIGADRGLVEAVMFHRSAAGADR